MHEEAGREGRAAAFQQLSRQEWEPARAYFECALAANPHCAETRHALGVIGWSTGDAENAIRHMEAAVHLRPDAGWLNNLAVLYAAQGRWQDAVPIFAESLRRNPDDCDTACHYGRALCETKQFPAAREVLAEAVDRWPHRASAWRDLGWALVEDGKPEQALGVLHRAIELVPRDARARQYAVQASLQLSRLEEAYLHARALCEHHPESSSFVRLAIACWELGQMEEAIAARDRAVATGIPDPLLHSGMLYLSLFDPGESAESLLAAHRVWRAAHAYPVASRTRHSIRGERDRPLRIGYVAAGLLTTPGRYFRVPLLRNADMAAFQTVLYDTRPDATATSYEYAALADTRADVSQLSDEEFRGRIVHDEIDILVDLLGHHNSNRMPVFSMRPAPVQVAFPSYPGTSGLDTFDCFLTDWTTTPPGTEDEYTEPVHRMERGFLMYAPPPSPPVTELPMLRNGYVTFGLFQRTAKIHGGFWDAAASVLRAFPDSRLLIHHADPGFDAAGSPARTRVEKDLAERGVQAERLLFRGIRGMKEHLDVLAEADVALDTFPYNGQTTTCECLWMGVPVVTCTGNRHAARIGAGLLQQVGLKQWAVQSSAEFIRMAERLASDVRGLSETRAELRPLLARSPLTDTERRTREIEGIYRLLWARWHETV